jgi:hypothetical protein
MFDAGLQNRLLSAYNAGSLDETHAAQHQAKMRE